MLPILSLVGPTASGKTGLAIAIAQEFAQRGVSAEIINIDTYQMYEGMAIGTAQPSAAELRAVPHHLLGCIAPSEQMSVARFQSLVREEMVKLRARGVLPLLVGGSGLYARAATDVMEFPATDERVRAGLERRGEIEGAGLLFAQLQREDPEAASRMDPRNIRRTIRALEVIAITGKPYSASLPQYQYAMPTVQIGLDVAREALDALIDARTARMRAEGLVEEVRLVRARLGITARRALGYEQIMEYLDGQLSEDEAFAQIAQKTKRLARKQMGWFGRDPRIHWLDAQDTQLSEHAMAIFDAEAKRYAALDSSAMELNAMGSQSAVTGSLSPTPLTQSSQSLQSSQSSQSLQPTQHHLGDITTYPHAIS